MHKKGFRGETSPEKMPVITTGIEMTRGTGKARVERLTGGNQPADETGASELVVNFIRRLNGEKVR